MGGLFNAYDSKKSKEYLPIGCILRFSIVGVYTMQSGLGPILQHAVSPYHLLH